MPELVSAGSKLRRLHPLAGKKELVAHFSENQPNHKRWHRKNRRAPDNRGQRSCELRVRHRNGRDRVDRTLQLLVSQHVENRARDIVDRNPTPPLPPVSQPSTQPHAEGWQHFWQGAANPAHHYPDADLNGTNPRLRRRPGGSFPLPADFSGESRTGPATLAQNFIAAIAVISHRGGRNETLGAVAPWPPLRPGAQCLACDCRGSAASWRSSIDLRCFPPPGESQRQNPKPTLGTGAVPDPTEFDPHRLPIREPGM